MLQLPNQATLAGQDSETESVENAPLDESNFDED